MIALLLALCGARRTISSVLLGSWTTAITYSSPPLDVVGPNLTFTQTGSKINYIGTVFDGEPVSINLSFVNLSGNITYRDEVYHFDLAPRPPPFVSTDIDMRELGFAHCIFTCYVTLRCSVVLRNQALTVTLRKTEGESGRGAFWIRALKVTAVVLSAGLAYFAFSKITARAGRAPAEPAKAAADAGTADEGEAPGAPESPEPGKLKTE
jgi:hypothetical protein